MFSISQGGVEYPVQQRHSFRQRPELPHTRVIRVSTHCRTHHTCFVRFGRCVSFRRTSRSWDRRCVLARKWAVSFLGWHLPLLCTSSRAHDLSDRRFRVPQVRRSARRPSAWRRASSPSSFSIQSRPGSNPIQSGFNRNE